MSFEEKSDVNGMRYDAKFDAHPKFGDKRASKNSQNMVVTSTLMRQIR